MRDFSEPFRLNLPSEDEENDTGNPQTDFIMNEEKEAFLHSVVEDFIVLLKQYRNASASQLKINHRVNMAGNVLLHIGNMVINQAAAMLAVLTSCATPLVSQAVAGRITEAMCGQSMQSAQERLDTHVQRMNVMLNEDVDAMCIFLAHLIFVKKNDYGLLEIDCEKILQHHPDLQ